MTCCNLRLLLSLAVKLDRWVLISDFLIASYPRFAKQTADAYLQRMFKAFEFCLPTSATKVPAGPEWLPLHQGAAAGLGLFADEFIPKGTVIWRFDGPVDRRYDESQLAALPEEDRERLLTFCYLNPGTRLYVCCGDNDRYINHSEQPNTEDLGFEEGVFEGEGITIAARDIQPGEEILSDYRSFDADARDGVI